MKYALNTHARYFCIKSFLLEKFTNWLEKFVTCRSLGIAIACFSVCEPQRSQTYVAFYVSICNFHVFAFTAWLKISKMFL